MGLRLVPTLVEKGYHVAVFVLEKDQGIDSLPRENVEIRYGDLRDPSSIDEALKDVHAVINLAAVQDSNNPKLNEEINFKGVINLVDGCKKHSIKRFIHSSSISTCYTKKSFYGKSKEKADEFIINSSGMDYTIIRPTLIYGDAHQGPFHTFLTILEKIPFIIPIIGDGKALKQPVFVDDVVSAFILALESETAVGKFYNISGLDVMTMEEMIDCIKIKKGITKLNVKIPPWILFPLACILEMLSENPPLTRGTLVTTTQDGTLDNSMIQKELGFEPSSFEAGLVKTNL